MTTKDIEGAQAGTVKTGLEIHDYRVGALSKRTTNPLEPEYPQLGRTQQVRQDQTYAEPWKEQPVKKANTRTKPEWKKSTVIPVIEERKAVVKSGAQIDPKAEAANVRRRLEIIR